MALNYVQGNVAILPEHLANDFLRAFASGNPKSCPLLAVWSPAIRACPVSAPTPTSAPMWRATGSGETVYDDKSSAIWMALWRDDLVTFVIGCSFSFEQGLDRRCCPCCVMSEGRNVAMYRTNIQTAATGSFHGPMVVSMRPMHRRQCDQGRSGHRPHADRTRRPGPSGEPHANRISDRKNPILATLWMFAPMKSRCSGPAASHRNPLSWKRGPNFASRMRQ